MNKMAVTWIIMCPKWRSEDHENKPHGWSLSQEELAKIGKDYFASKLECTVCGHKFSLQQGVKEAFMSDISFTIHEFQFNSRENGEAEILVGQLKTIEFVEPFEDKPEIYLTPEQPINVMPGRVTNAQFSIFSSDSGTEDQKGKLSWAAFGNRAYGKIPIWRKLLSSSKKHQLKKDFRPELVDLESAIEVFIGEYLGKNLKTKLRYETVNWILKRSITEQMKIGFVELKGNPLSEIEPKAYGRWQKNVKELRDSIVHRGVSVTKEQACEARDAVFDLVTRINPNTIDQFQINLKEIRLKHPNITFGTATIKAGKKSTEVQHAKGIK